MREGAAMLVASVLSVACGDCRANPNANGATNVPPSPTSSRILADPVRPPTDDTVKATQEASAFGDSGPWRASHCLSAAKRKDSGAQALYCEGARYYSIGNLSDARRLLRQAYKKDPENTSYALAYAKAGMIAGEADLREILDKALASEPDQIELWHQRGLLEIHYGEPANSLPFLERARKLDPKDVELKVSIAWAHTAMGDLSSARREWLEIVTNHSLKPEWHYKYGRFLHTIGETRKARAHLEIAAKPRKLEDGGWQFWWVVSAGALLERSYDAGPGPGF
jgi:tetratricopeptide (TPR) repeat protein